MHRAEPQSAVRAHTTVVQTVVGKMGLDVREMDEFPGLGLETVQPTFQPDNKTAATHGDYEPGQLGCRPCASLARRWVIAMQLPAFDVDEPERGVARNPCRPLAKLRSDVANVLDFHTLLFCRHADAAARRRAAERLNTRGITYLADATRSKTSAAAWKSPASCRSTPRDIQ